MQSRTTSMYTPRDVTVENFTPSTLTLSWSSKIEDGVEAVYKLLYWPTNMPKDMKLATTARTSYTLDDLVPGELYTIWVVAIVGNITSDYVTVQQQTRKTRMIKGLFLDSMILMHDRWLQFYELKRTCKCSSSGVCCSNILNFFYCKIKIYVL